MKNRRLPKRFIGFLLKITVIVLILLIPWSLIFLAPIHQGLVAVFVAGIIGLLIQQYYLKQKPDIENRRLLLKRWIGFLLIAIGILLIYYLPPIVIPMGLFPSWISIWPISNIIGLAGLLFMDVELKASLKAILITHVFLIPWSMILLLSLPYNSEGLLAVFVAGVGFLLYRRYYLKRKPDR